MVLMNRDSVSSQLENLALARRAPEKSARGNEAPADVTASKFAVAKSANSPCALVRSARARFAPRNMQPRRVVRLRFAAARLARAKSLPPRLQPLRSTPARFA